MPDHLYLANEVTGLPKCRVPLDPSITVSDNFTGELGYTDAPVNVRWAKFGGGAVGDGVTDDAPAIRLAVAYALSNKRTLWFPPGDYLVNSQDPSMSLAGIGIQSDDGISVMADMKATLIAGTGLSSTIPSGSPGRLVRIQSNGGTTGKVSWVGGSFDTSQIPGSITGVDVLSIGPKFESVVVKSVVFDHGVGTPAGVSFGTGGGDSSLYLKEAEHVEITGCKFKGAADLGIYLSGDSSAARTGRHATISGNHFYRCGSGASVKRGFSRVTFSGNHIEECGNGFFSGVSETSETGDKLIISGNTITKTQGNPIRLTNTDKAIISGNIITDWRRWISDGTTETGASSGNLGGGIIIEGTGKTTITGNEISYEDWVKVTSPTNFSVGVSVTHSAQTSGVGCNNVTITGNEISNVESGFFVSNTSSDVVILGNDVTDVDNPSRLGTSATVIGDYQAGTGTVSGYIEMKDAGGTIRKLAVIP